jgi:hypothetical protein
LEFIRSRGSCGAYTDIFHALQASLVGIESKSNPPRKLKLLPMPSKFESTIDQFVGSLQSVVQLADLPYVESKKEVAKYLFDLSEKSKKFLVDSQCQEIIMSTFQKLLEDANHEVQEIAVFALSKFIQMPCYLEKVAKSYNLIFALCSIMAIVIEPQRQYLYHHERQTASEIITIVRGCDSKIVDSILAEAQLYNPIETDESSLFAVY